MTYLHIPCKVLTVNQTELLAGMMEASGDDDDAGEGFEDEEYGEDGDDVELTDGSEQQQDDEEEEDAWDAAPAPAVATNAIRQAWNRAGRHAAAAQQQQQQQEQELGFSAAVPLLMPEQWRRPGACSFLQRGVTFEGCQRLSTQQGARRREEQWTVSVVIQVSGSPDGWGCWPLVGAADLVYIHLLARTQEHCQICMLA
jgi:hypothetical protein